MIANALDTFENLRPRLLGIAYRMLGTWQDAEDVVQDVYLRWHEADIESVREPAGWLVAATTRRSIDRLRRLSAERELYTGEWLPEPLPLSPVPRADGEVETESDLSMAFLVMLQRLSPEERAVFLLREVFDTEYSGIARVLEKSEDAVRQMMHRARRRVREDRVRQHVDPGATERLLERFVEALRNDDEAALLSLVGPDAAWTSDSGGKARAARRTLHGAHRIAKFARGLTRKFLGAYEFRIVHANGEPALATFDGDRLISLACINSDGQRILEFYHMRNPDKLRLVQAAAPVAAML